MATYNGARFLRPQLDSLANQTLLPFEIVITDDQSSDSTADVIADFARTAPFLVRFYRNQERLGYGENFLQAAALCKGDLISFCDQDDVWIENKLQTCEKTFRDPGVLLCVHSGELWEGGKERNGRRIPQYPNRKTFDPSVLYPLQGSYGYAMVFRRQLLQFAANQDRFCSLPGESPMSHDRWIWFLGTIFGKTALLPDVLALYRQHEHNTMGGISTSLSDSIMGASKSRNEVQRARIEEHAVKYLDHLASQPVEDATARLASQAARLLEQSEIYTRYRGQIFENESSVRTRWSIFLKILFAGAYANPSLRAGRTGQNPHRSPLRGIVRDFAFGVFHAGILLKR